MFSAVVKITFLVVMAVTPAGFAISAELPPNYDTRAKANEIGKQSVRANVSQFITQWTVVGSIPPSVESHNDARWSVRTNSHELLVVQEPISDIKILSTSEPVPNTVHETTMSIVAAQGEYEPASFVIRAGTMALHDVELNISDLVEAETGLRLQSNNVQIRLVKNWYQAGTSIRRKLGDTNVLTPELLLRDNNLVRTDPTHKANHIRGLARMKDSSQVLPFDVLGETNQQIWLTAFVPQHTSPGKYQGEIKIRFQVGSRHLSDQLTISITVLPFTLPDPVMDYALFYTSHLLRNGKASVNAAVKTEAQMLEDFVLMRNYGFTNVAIDHKFRWSAEGRANFDDLAIIMVLMRKAGFTGKRFLYVDWHVTDSRNAILYADKIDQLRKLANAHGFTELYVYQQDEKTPGQLVTDQESLAITHAHGAKSFVATIPDGIDKLDGLLDIAILNRTLAGELEKVRAVGITPWAYDSPQAGEEKPGTFRDTYGIQLWLDGFDGTCAYAYQTGSARDATGWDDWGSDQWRPHILAYPTLTTPIPTLQLEGWREAIDDVRYLGLLLKRAQNGQGDAPNETRDNRARRVNETLGLQLSTNPATRRRQIISFLLRSAEMRQLSHPPTIAIHNTASEILM